jgi:hypothetical protein
MSWRKIVVLLGGLALVAVLVPVSAGATSHYFTQTKIVQSHGGTSGIALCPHGWHITGGGVSDDNSDNSGPSQVEDSAPVVRVNHTQGWFGIVVDNGSGQQQITVYADCMN